jgi:hypothetical protein
LGESLLISILVYTQNFIIADNIGKCRTVKNNRSDIISMTVLSIPKSKNGIRWVLLFF